MKNIVSNVYKIMKDNYLSLSKYKRVILNSLAIVFILVLSFSLCINTELIMKLKQMIFIKYMTIYLKGIPIILNIILFIIAVPIIYIIFFSKKDKLPLQVINISHLDKPDVSSNMYEITLVNNTNKNIFLKKLKVNWIYNPGNACSIGEAVAINSIAKYILDIPINVCETEKQSLYINMNPIIIIPGKNKFGPGFLQFQVQIHYHLIGDIKYHPQYNWDITFDLDIIDETNRSFNIFNNYKWRTEEEICATNDGVLSQYNEQLKNIYSSKHLK